MESNNTLSSTKKLTTRQTFYFLVYFIGLVLPLVHTIPIPVNSIQPSLSLTSSSGSLKSITGALQSSSSSNKLAMSSSATDSSSSASGTASSLNDPQLFPVSPMPRTVNFPILGEIVIPSTVTGAGEAGNVYKVTSKKIKTPFAVKIPKYTPTVLREYYQKKGLPRLPSMENEMDALKATNKYLYHVKLPDGRIIIAMKWENGQSLKSMSSQIQSKEDLQKVGTAIQSAFSEVHAKGVLHHDVQAENVLIKERKGVQKALKGKYKAKVIDFGFSEQVKPSKGPHLGEKDMLGINGMLSEIAAQNKIQL